MNKKKWITTCVAVITGILGAAAQSLPGYVMIAGGGSETQGGWSDAPYGWVVEHAQNKKVACITFDNDPGSWIPDYFKSLGAVHARNFVINSFSVANAQATYDSIIGYDAVFFKGGDQWNYYENYKGSLLEQAVMQIYSTGGVLSGTSAGLHLLSEVVFTAENGTVYPEEALEDPFNPYMSLENDFLPAVPNAVFDSHVAERGRFGRILGFLGHWKIGNGSDITGVGVDDKTAFCIDTGMLGTAYGTGAVNIYRAAAENNYSISGTKLLASGIEVSQLLHQCTIDFKTMEITGLEEYTEPSFYGEAFSGRMLLSATDDMEENAAFFQRLGELSAASVIIITGYETNLAEAVQAALLQAGISSEVLSTIPGNYDDPLWLEKLQASDIYLFAGNELQVLKDFMEYGSNGEYLWEQLRAGTKIAAFMGSDSRLAGKSAVTNFEQEYASYDGLLEFEEGLKLLQNTVVMPYTFSGDVDEENTATGVPYAMVLDDLAYGLWMHGNAFTEVSGSGEEVLLEFSGRCPVAFIENHGSAAAFAAMPASFSGMPRNIAGFERFSLRLLDESTPLTLPEVSSTEDNKGDQAFDVYPNPVRGKLYIHAPGHEQLRVMICDLSGKVVMMADIGNGEALMLDELESGSYIISLVDAEGTPLLRRRIVKIL